MRTARKRLARYRAEVHIRPPPTVVVWSYVVQLAIVFAAYVVGGKLGLAVPFTSGNVSPIWPSAGIALAAVLLGGSRIWPAIAAAAFLVNVLTPISPGAALALAAGNTTGPIAAAWLLRRLSGFRASLNRLDDVIALIVLAAPVGAAISATVGVTVLFTTRVDPWSGFWPAWIVWWLGDATGILLVAPLVLTLFARRRLTEARRLPELAALYTVAIIVCLMIFDQRMSAGAANDVLAFAVFPVVIWGAIRFEIPGAAGVTLLICAIAVWETQDGVGPFVRNSTLQNATMLQGFIGVLAVSGLTLSASITERALLIRRQAQREGIEEGERRYREIVETANDGVWMLDSQLVTVFVNARMADILGYSVNEMVRRPLVDFVFEHEWVHTRDNLHRRGSALHERGQTHYRRKDGSDMWATVSRTRAFGVDGTLTGVLEMVSDISGQKRAEGERQDAQDRVALLSKAVEQTADTVLITDDTEHIEYVNPAFEHTTGYSQDEALGRTPRFLQSAPHDDALYEDIWGRLRRGDAYSGTVANRKKTGALYWANQTITPLKDARGHTTHFVAVLNDVTDARRYHERDVQLRLARVVQQRFSAPAPRVHGFDIAAASHPADETGGDYFDFIEAPDGVLYVAIGDVSGHGFDAALIMALARAYIRSFTGLGMNVGEILGRANLSIIGDIEENRYVTMLLVRLEAHTGRMTYASAGHLPGVLLRPSRGTDCIMDSTGIPLGLFADATFATRELQIETPDILVLGTDGATETSDGAGSEFGRGGVIDYVRAHANESASDIAGGVYAAARSFGAAEPQHDDITSVIVKATAPCAHQHDCDAGAARRHHRL